MTILTPELWIPRNVVIKIPKIESLSKPPALKILEPSSFPAQYSPTLFLAHVFLWLSCYISLLIPTTYLSPQSSNSLYVEQLSYDPFHVNFSDP